MASTHSRLKDWAGLAALTFCFLALDLGTKWLVRQNLAWGESWAPIPALSKIFTITYVRNTGVSFGQLPGLGWLFMLVNLIVLVAVLVYYPRIPAGMWQLRLASPLIMTGALGNLTDRLSTALVIAQDGGGLWAALPHSYVTDMFDFQIWPVFNVADFCVVTGVSIVAWMLWRSESTDTVAEAATHDP